MEDKLCLTWKDFQENLSTSFSRLRESNNFTDVTLVCEDGERIESHKVILAAFSPVFEKLLLQGTVHPHPLIYMRGTKKVDLVAVIDFLYFGEANILQENVDSFLAVAEDLKVKGLQKEMRKEEEIATTLENPKMRKEEERATTLENQKTTKRTPKRKEKQEKSSAEVKSELVEYSPNGNGIGDGGSTNNSTDQLKMHKAKVNSMLEKSENHITNESYNLQAYSCKECGKEGVKTNIEKHIEKHHIEGIALPCPFCEKICKSTTALTHHKKTSHTDVKSVEKGNSIDNMSVILNDMRVILNE